MALRTSMIVRYIAASGTVCIAVVFLTIFGGSAWAQTSSPGPAVDLEVIHSSDGTNLFCVAPNESLVARLFIRPGTTTTSCTPACGTVVDGGAAHLATAVVDIDFNHEKLSFTSAANNPLTAAVDGLVQDNSAQGRIGWALAGDWTPDADTSGTLATPCAMRLLDSAEWVLELEFTALPSATGITSLHVRRATDPVPFSLSFADLCGAEALSEANDGIDEIVDGTVLVSPSCAATIFFDGFESRSSGRWTSSSGQ